MTHVDYIESLISTKEKAKARGVKHETKLKEEIVKLKEIKQKLTPHESPAASPAASPKPVYTKAVLDKLDKAELLAIAKTMGFPPSNRSQAPSAIVAWILKNQK